MSNLSRLKIKILKELKLSKKLSNLRLSIFNNLLIDLDTLLLELH
jgi:hypothetical protein